MLLWLSILAFFVGLGGLIYTETSYKYHPTLSLLSLSSTVLGGVLVMISLIVIVAWYIPADSFVARSKQRYEMLVYQYENDIYDNDNDLGKRELIEDIRYWNEDLAKYKVLQNDFWIGIYIPDVYDQLEFISLERKDR